MGDHDDGGAPAARNDDRGAPRGDRGGGDRGGDRGGPTVECPDVAELIRYMAVNLVERPDEVRVELVEERNANVYELEVSEPDLGKVIGRGGKTARACAKSCKPSHRARASVLSSRSSNNRR